MGRTIIADSESPRLEISAQGVGGVLGIHERCFQENGDQFYAIFPDRPGYKPKKNDFLMPSIQVPFTNGYRIAVPRSLQVLDLKTQIRLRSWLMEIGPDLVIHHGPYQVASRVDPVAGFMDVPRILWIHTDLAGYIESRVPEALWPVAKRMQLSQAKKLASKARLTVFPSYHARDKFIGLTDFRGETCVLPSSIVPFELMDKTAKEKFEKVFRKKGHLPLDPIAYPMLGTTGRLEEEKKQKNALRAFAKVVEYFREIPVPKSGIICPVFVFVGDGSQRQELEKLVIELGLDKEAKRLGVGTLVYFAGELVHEEVEKFVQILAAFVFPSDTDTQGLALVEAAFARCVVFGLMGYSFDEFFHDSILATPNDPAIMASRIHTVLGDKKIYEAKSEFCHSVAMRYSNIGAYSKEFLAMCESVL